MFSRKQALVEDPVKAPVPEPVKISRRVTHPEEFYITKEDVSGNLLYYVAQHTESEWKLLDCNYLLVAMWDGDEPPAFLRKGMNKDARAKFILRNRDGWQKDVPIVQDYDEVTDFQWNVRTAVLHLIKLHQQGGE